MFIRVKQLCPRIAVFLFSISSAFVFANPVLNGVTSGQASVSQSANTTTVNQTSQQAIIEWNSFNIAAQEKTQFVQPNSSSVTLNRIDPGQGASQIYGQLTSNGRIILINGAGIHFGPNSLVNVGSLIASTADISNANFLAGKYIFDVPTLTNGSIVNDGKISAAHYGLVALLGDSVSNSGTIRARLGSIAIGAGSKFTLDFNGDQLINFSVDAPASSHSTYVKNTGKLLADGGQIVVSASAAAGVLNNVIDMEGVAITRSVSQSHGEIILSGNDHTSMHRTRKHSIVLNGGDNGTVYVSAGLIASGRHSGQFGGTVTITGNTIQIAGATKIDVSGDAGGGVVNIGGSAHGEGPLPNATTTSIASGAIINASALQTGNGGDVVVWSNQFTNVAGTILANGGVFSGNGGAVETSSENVLSISGGAVNTLAPKGVTGNWLLDPASVTISTVDLNVTGNPNFVPTSASSTTTINTSDITTALMTSNVTISTTNTGTAGGGAATITVASPLAWNSTYGLTLTAGSAIVINAAITAANGSLTLSAPNSASSITTGASGAINVGKFTLASGYFYQNTTTLPSFSTASFTLATSAKFIRATGGTGVNGNPYVLTDIYGIQGMGGYLTSWFTLGNNIDATGTSKWNGTTTNSVTTYAGFSPIGNNSTAWNGNFNGGGYTINGLYIYQPTNGNIGMFGTTIGSVSSVSYVTLSNVNVTGGGTVGALIGNSGNATGLFTNDYVTSGQVTGGSYVGGIAGVARFNLSHVSNGATINDSQAGGIQIGGIVGFIDSGYSISYATNTGTINVSNISSGVGGILGGGNSPISYSNNSGTINVANLTSGSGQIGGITGSYNLAISYSSNTGNINIINSTTTQVGGLVGNLISSGSITNSYNAGNITTTNSTVSKVGGIAGSSNTTISNSYNVGSVSGTTNVGALIGSNSGSVSNNYFDTGTSGTTFGVNGGNVAGVTGLTDVQMKVSTNYTGFNFTGATPVWTISAATGSYPYPTLYNNSVAYSGNIINGTGLSGDGISIYVNGIAVASSTVTSSGTFSFNLTTLQLPTNTPYLIALTNGASGGVIDSTSANSTNMISLAFSAGSLTVGDTVDNFNFSNTSLAAAIGNISNTLYSASGTSIALASNISLTTLANINFNINGTITTSGSGSINFNGATIATSNPIVTSATGAITFSSSVYSTTASNLTITSASGTIALNGAMSGINNLIVNTAANATLAGSTVTTIGSQTYNAPVILGSSTTLTTGANISLAQGISGSGKNLSLIGNVGDNTFTLTGPDVVNNISVTGSTAGNTFLSVQSSDATQNYLISAANAGSIIGVTEVTGAFTFSSIKNLIGGSHTNVFTFTGGSLAGNITGGSGSNSIFASNVANTFHINGFNSGYGTQLGGFTHIQNITGGSLSNAFIFDNGGSISGMVSGANTTSSNSINFTGNTSLLTFSLTGNNGSVSNLNGNISNFKNMTLLIGNGQSTLSLLGASNSLYISGGGSGYVNDPVNFLGISNFTTSMLNTPLTFTIPATYNYAADQATVNGMVMSFSNFAFPVDPIPPSVPIPVAPMIPTNASTIPPAVNTANVATIITQGQASTVVLPTNQTPNLSASTQISYLNDSSQVSAIESNIPNAVIIYKNIRRSCTSVSAYGGVNGSITIGDACD